MYKGENSKLFSRLRLQSPLYWSSSVREIQNNSKFDMKRRKITVLFHKFLYVYINIFQLLTLHLLIQCMVQWLVKKKKKKILNF